MPLQLPLRELLALVQLKQVQQMLVLIPQLLRQQPPLQMTLQQLLQIRGVPQQQQVQAQVLFQVQALVLAPKLQAQRISCQMPLS